MVLIAFSRVEASSSAAIRSRTSDPETGEAVVAMRMMLCVRAMSYLRYPKVQLSQNACNMHVCALGG